MKKKSFSKYKLIIRLHPTQKNSFYEKNKEFKNKKF